jgi:hypothetical protein
MFDFDLFELFNPAQPGQRKSRLQYLIETSAFREEWASDAADRLEGYKSPYIAAFIQLPSPVFTEDVVHRMPAHRQGIDVDLQFKPFLFCSTPYGSPAIETAPSETRANATQVIAYCPLWGRWARGYERYTNCFTTKGMNDLVVLQQREYSGGRTLRAKDFEHELANRIHVEIGYALRRFLKSYSVIVKAQHAEPQAWYGSFLMPYPGRVSQFGTPTPLLQHFLQERALTARPLVKSDLIRRGVDFGNRKFSRFENQIFELARLVQTGNFALAIAGALSLTEWLLRLSAPRSEKRLRFVELIAYFSSKGLAEERPLLDELRKLRNTAMHLGEYSGSREKRPHEILNVNVDEILNGDIARQAIDLAWRIFQKANSGALSGGPNL